MINRKSFVAWLALRALSVMTLGSGTDAIPNVGWHRHLVALSAGNGVVVESCQRIMPRSLPPPRYNPVSSFFESST